MPLAGQGGPPGRAPVQQALRTLPSTREKESSTDRRGQRVVIWGARLCQTLPKQVLVSLNFYRSCRLVALTYFPNSNLSRNLLISYKLLHCKTFPCFSHVCIGHKQCWHCLGTCCPNSVKKDEGCNFPLALNSL